MPDGRAAPPPRSSSQNESNVLEFGIIFSQRFVGGPRLVTLGLVQRERGIGDLVQARGLLEISQPVDSRPASGVASHPSMCAG